MSNATATLTHTGYTVNDELDEKYNCAAMILNIQDDDHIILKNDIKISTVKCWIYVQQSWCNRFSPQNSTLIKG